VLSGAHVPRFPLPVVVLAALAVATLFGMWNGLLVSFVGMQPIVATLILLVAGRGVAQLITSGQIITIYYSPISSSQRLRPRHPILALHRRRRARRARLPRAPDCPRLFIEAIGLNPMAARFTGVRASSITFWVYAVCGLCAGIAGLIVSSNVKSADGTTPACSSSWTPSSPWSWAERRFRRPLHAPRQRGGRPHHPDAHHHHLLRRRPARGDAGGEGAVVFVVSILQSDRIRNRIAALGQIGEAAP